jgi:GT2 family glycosyltransferase
MNRENITIATVFFGGEAVLEKTLPTWLESFEGTGTLFSFVDNTASNGVGDLLQTLGFFEGGNTSYVKSPRNLGFADGANQAIENATTDIVFLLNPDTFMDRETAVKILSDPTSPSHPFIAFGLRTRGEVSTGISVNKIGFFIDATEKDSLVIGPSGGAMMLNRKNFLELGGFSSQLFAWGEDAEFALRLFAHGIRTKISPIVVEHYGGHSVNSLEGAKFKAILLNRNRLLITRATLTPSARAVVLPLLLAGVLANMISTKKKRSTAASAFIGVLEGLRNPVQFSWKKELRLGLHDFRVLTKRGHYEI